MPGGRLLLHQVDKDSQGMEMRSQHIRLSKKFQYGAAKKVDDFSPSGVINWDPEKKGESGCQEEWKKPKEKSAEPWVFMSRTMQCRKRGKPADEPGSKGAMENEGPVATGSAGGGRTTEAARPACFEEQLQD